MRNMYYETLGTCLAPQDSHTRRRTGELVSGFPGTHTQQAERLWNFSLKCALPMTASAL